MKNLILLLLFPFCIFSQKVQIIELKQNIKDNKNLTKSLTLIDNRVDKQIGYINYHEKQVELKFESDDLVTLAENWYSKDNKNPKGSNEIVLLLEELKVEYTSDNYPIVKTKITSFLKRNDKYYFVNRYQNADAFLARSTPNTIGDKTAVTIANFVRETYLKVPISIGIPEANLFNYENFLMDNLKVFNSKLLKEGVYVDYKTFGEQNPFPKYHIVKNKKNEIVKIDNEQDLRVKDLDLFGFVDDGIPYKITPVGYLEIFRDEKGLYIISNKEELAPQNTSGVTVGLMIGGGIAGAAIGMMINSQLRKNRVDSGFYNIYLDSFTGTYVYEK